MIRNRSTFTVKARDYSAPSRTVPDETLTIRELVTRFVRNTAPADLVRHELVYDEECNVGIDGVFHGNGRWDVNPCTDGNVDLVDVADMSREYNELQKELKSTVKLNQKSK